MVDNYHYRNGGLFMFYEITQVHLSQYITGLYEEEKSPHTIEKYLRDVKSFCSFTGGLFPGKETVLSWKKHLSGNYRPRSANSMLASLNHFFSWMGWEACRTGFRLRPGRIRCYRCLWHTSLWKRARMRRQRRLSWSPCMRSARGLQRWN